MRPIIDSSIHDTTPLYRSIKVLENDPAISLRMNTNYFWQPIHKFVSRALTLYQMTSISRDTFNGTIKKALLRENEIYDKHVRTLLWLPSCLRMLHIEWKMFILISHFISYIFQCVATFQVRRRYPQSDVVDMKNISDIKIDEQKNLAICNLIFTVTTFLYKNTLCVKNGCFHDMMYN